MPDKKNTSKPPIQKPRVLQPPQNPKESGPLTRANPKKNDK